jgi:hypothetical protein
MNRQPLLFGLLLLALLVVFLVLFTMLGKEYRHHWGATEAEVAMPLPGDTLIGNPDVVTTHAISINAPPERIWPWIAQMGQRRGGFYTHTALENLAGLKVTNAWEIRPEWRLTEVGDLVHLAPGDDAVLSVREIRPDTALVLQMWNINLDVPSDVDSAPNFEWVWSFTLHPVDDSGTRLIIRTHVAAPGVSGASVGGAMMDLISWVMETGMLRGIQIRSEREGLTGH